MSKRLAQRFLERRFKEDSVLHERYVDFMRDYLEAGHMSIVTDSGQNLEHPVVYLPHHGVVKETSSTTKLRVVFDASSKTSSGPGFSKQNPGPGKSLNDVLRVGTTNQSSLFDIIMRFRFHDVVLTGDIRQMYRQVLVHPDDRDYQRILWRFSQDEPVKEFRLNTVTYGQASSAYLAIKCIQMLAEEARADDIESAVALREQLEMVLQRGGFMAHKWCSNSERVMDKVPIHLRENTSSIRIDAEGTIKTLGLEWNPKADEFQFFVAMAEAAVTKREVLSEISKFFDPHGLIGPVLTAAKLIMRQA
ncbi:PREDICTED: uncharacterized protein LOC108773930 [Cyphomyrmex costatus]|uniref:uncharacterized protein LOC108773930 n=1 Tax=Cyphomyrmex costatus TaxID=456900 RepID=UPI00085232E8|nr:PREDICTED: uncharacterized protein LOC108773930 [Cyphomyrmex costatus]